ncbi:hypothetical protein QF034_001133 [Streptomyces africanus]|uniref:Uncharacterized protein n=1 Tax=Streptomyces africanus TaxID=231024 RepID=A0ABU0QHQ0_9ACTN|nr:hypothetical protein [Streptomyces africanus]MDQ0746902.1 hypothetical protein [Streptomyces africanus]
MSSYDEALELAVIAIQETVRKRLDLAFGHDDRAALVDGFVKGEIAFVIFDDVIQTMKVYDEQIVIPDDASGLDGMDSG